MRTCHVRSERPPRLLARAPVALERKKYFPALPPGEKEERGIGLEQRTRMREAWGGTRFQLRLGTFQSHANLLAEVGRERQIGDALHMLCTGGDLEQLCHERDGLRRCHAWSAGMAVPDIRLVRDKNRYHGYPKCSAQDHQNQHHRQTQA